MSELAIALQNAYAAYARAAARSDWDCCRVCCLVIVYLQTLVTLERNVP